MGENSAIEWTDHTFNPWSGCTRVSPGCENCYAETFSKRTGHGKRLPLLWGVDAEREARVEEYWKKPVIWNRRAAERGVRESVFCASHADIFELVPERNVQARAVQDASRARLWPLIETTPHLNWLLLTKRPENVRHLAPWRTLAAEGRYDDRPGWPDNVWIGTTVEDQQRADERIPWLIEIPARVRFVSCEPLLEAVDLENIHPYYLKRDPHPHDPIIRLDALRGHMKGPDDMLDHKVDWVIVGGESGAKRRPFEIEWLANIAAQCRAAGVAVFTKQDGALHSGLQGRIPDAFWLKELPRVA